MSGLFKEPILFTIHLSSERYKCCDRTFQKSAVLSYPQANFLIKLILMWVYNRYIHLYNRKIIVKL